MKSRLFIAVLVCALASTPLASFGQTKKTTAKKTTTKTTTTTKTPAKTPTPPPSTPSAPTVGVPATTPPTPTSATQTPPNAPQPQGGIMKTGSPTPSAGQTAPPQQTAPAQSGAPQIALPSSPLDISPNLAADGLKEALTKGIQKGVELVSKTDGYLGNPVIRIPFPPELKMVEDGVRKIGLGKVADDAVTSMNRAAEQAAIDALPIFLDAIRQLTFNDVLSILNGANDRAATDFLQRTTSSQLTQKFKPTILDALNKVEATKHWGQITGAYNKLPFVQKVNPDLPQYVTERAVEGLFTMVAQEEKNIRKDPVARTSDVLQQVFGGITKGGGK